MLMLFSDGQFGGPTPLLWRCLHGLQETLAGAGFHNPPAFFLALAALVHLSLAPYGLIRSGRADGAAPAVHPPVAVLPGCAWRCVCGLCLFAFLSTPAGRALLLIPGGPSWERVFLPADAALLLRLGGAWLILTALAVWVRAAAADTSLRQACSVSATFWDGVWLQSGLWAGLAADAPAACALLGCCMAALSCAADMGGGFAAARRGRFALADARLQGRWRRAIVAQVATAALLAWVLARGTANDLDTLTAGRVGRARAAAERIAADPKRSLAAVPPAVVLLESRMLPEVRELLLLRATAGAGTAGLHACRAALGSEFVPVRVAGATLAGTVEPRYVHLAADVLQQALSDPGLEGEVRAAAADAVAVLAAAVSPDDRELLLGILGPDLALRLWSLIPQVRGAAAAALAVFCDGSEEVISVLFEVPDINPRSWQAAADELAASPAGRRVAAIVHTTAGGSGSAEMLAALARAAGDALTELRDTERRNVEADVDEDTTEPEPAEWEPPSTVP